MRPTLTAALIVTTCAGAALAHTGVTNPAATARMHQMDEIKDTAAALGQITKGAVAFDAALAAELRATLARQAGAIPALFAAAETDPKSEARPELWANWTGFVADAQALEIAAQQMRTGTREEVQFGMRAVAKACSGCHEDFRVEK